MDKSVREDEPSPSPPGAATRVVAAVMASTADEMRQAAQDACEGADLVEFRVDALQKPDLPDLEDLRRADTGPSILTCRKQTEGGVFQGSEPERLEILRRALGLGFAFVDIELDSFSPELRATETSSQLILSHHNFDSMPEDLSGIVERAAAAGADIVKVAARTDSLADVVRLAEAGRLARSRGVGFAPVPMGPAGTAGRVLARGLGADLTYAAARGLPATGPGQLDLDELLGNYRFRALDNSTKVYGVLGGRALASLSPVMHNSVFAQKGLNAVYVPFEERDLGAFVSAAKEIGVAGFSVTQPFKESILPFLDDVDGPAQKIGAVNTILNREGRWRGFNTDVDGVLGPVSRRVQIAGRRAVILGAGGAARAAAVGLNRAGAEVLVLARRLEQAQAVSELVGGHAGQINELAAHRWDILVNATPLFDGLIDVSSAEQKDAFHPGVLVLDMIYDPEVTEILELAREKKAFAVPGLEMLIAQAVRQTEIWTGEEGSAEVMETAAREEMLRRRKR